MYMASSIDAIPTKVLETLLECSLCLETLSNPRTLHCFHSFCQCCLERFIQSRRDNENPAQLNTFECPICRSDFKLNPQEGVEGIGVNYFVRNMLDAMAVESRVKGIPCHHCQKADKGKASLGRCVNCEIFMCEECLLAHSNYPGFKNHSVLSMDELSKPENRSKIRGKPRCREHDDEILKFFCETCEKLICRDCKDENHEDHECSPLKKAAEQKNEKLKKWCTTLSDELDASNEALQVMNNVVRVLDDNVKAAKNKIRERKDEILAAVGRMLEEKEKSLTDKIDAMHRVKSETINKQLCEGQVYANQVRNSMDLCKSLLENGDAVEIVSSHKIVTKKIENVERGDPGGWKPVNDGSIPFNQCSTDAAMDVEMVKLSERLGEIEDEDYMEILRDGLSHETQNKLKVWVYKGDIVQEDTDIIVNSCNSHLNHMVGVAWAIAKAGGPSIQRESDEYVKEHDLLSVGDVGMTGAGHLKCQKILHAFGPSWHLYSKDETMLLLRKTLHNVFRISFNLRAKSVAVPAISAGSLGVPVEVCARAFFSVIEELDGKLTGPFEIRLVDIDPKNIEAFRKEFNHWRFKILKSG